MKHIRFRIKVNPGTQGRLTHNQLVGVITATRKFLDSFIEDLDIKIDSDSWFVEKLGNPEPYIDYSAGIEAEADVEKAVTRASEIINELVDQNLESSKNYKRIATDLPKDGKLMCGFSQNGDKDEESFEWGEISAADVDKQEPKEVIEPVMPLKYYGSIRGRIHSWITGENYITVRDLFGGGTVTRCIYPNSLYKEIHKLTQKRGAVVVIEGDAKLNRESRQIETIKVRKVGLAPIYRKGDLEKFVGCVPDITNGLSSSEYIRKIRGEDDD